MSTERHHLRGNIVYANRYYETLDLWTDTSNAVGIVLATEADAIAIAKIINKHIDGLVFFPSIPRSEIETF
jgi:hypothetical protein